MKKGSLDDSVFYSPPATGLPLFSDRSDAPSVPRASSERGAEVATRWRLTVSQSATILHVLAYYEAIEGSGKFFARDRLCLEIPTLSVNAACGRLGPSGMLQQDRYIVATEDSARSFAGLTVTGYQITRAGLDLLSLAAPKSAVKNPAVPSAVSDEERR